MRCVQVGLLGALSIGLTILVRTFASTLVSPGSPSAATTLAFEEYVGFVCWPLTATNPCTRSLAFSSALMHMQAGTHELGRWPMQGKHSR